MAGMFVAVAAVPSTVTDVNLNVAVPLGAVVPTFVKMFLFKLNVAGVVAEPATVGVAANTLDTDVITPNVNAVNPVISFLVRFIFSLLSILFI